MNLQNPKFTLIAIGALFLTPLLLAILMRSSWWNFEPSSFSNLGKLVEPALVLPLSRLDIQYAGAGTSVADQQQWVLLYPFDAVCDPQCLKDIASLRQIHLAAGRKRPQVAIWILSPKQTSPEVQKSLLAVYPELDILIDPSGDAMRILNSISTKPDASGAQPQTGQAFLLDPAANIILHYTPGFDPNDIDQDLGRLLTWSGSN